LGFEVPYEFRGAQHMYRPDFIVRIDDGRGPDDPLNLIVEVKGARDDQDAAKSDTMRTRWLPGVNAARRFGRWDFIECRNPYAFVSEVRAFLAARRVKAA
jgi:type III restriction enzyme